MARIDSVLSIVVQQGADELRLGTDREPRMFARGSPRRLSIPVTSEDTLRELLAGALTEQRHQSMRDQGRVEFDYEARGLGGFRVVAAGRADGGFDVVFARAPAVPIRARQAPKGEESAEATGANPVTGAGSVDALAAGAGVPPGAAHPWQPVPSEPPAEFARLIAEAAALRASDLHLCEGRPPTIRVDGSLRTLAPHGLNLRTLVALDPGQEERVAAGRSADVGFDVRGVGRVRLHLFRTAEGLSAAVRLLPEAAPALGALALPVALDDIVHLPHGLVLVGGATGAGKSTTLAALAQLAVTRRSVALTTLEDPIEYRLAAPETSIVRRRQVGRDVSDFATGLRDALREDPDVLLVGEMRDPETISLALTAAETGHLVLSSLHCRSAASAIERIVDAYRPAREQYIRAQLADSLRVVVVQHLVPRARGNGRLAVLEVLRVTHAVAALIREGRTAQIASALQSGKREGMLSLERCLADRTQAGEIRIEDARAVANDPSSLALYLAK